MKIKLNYKGVDLDIDFDYREAEMQVLDYGDGSGYPGCSGGIDCINEITHKGASLLLLLDADLNEIEELILEEL